MSKKQSVICNVQSSNLKSINLDRCVYCWRSIDTFSRTVDHLYPKSKGGIRSNKNKVPCCIRCNQMKGSLDIVEFKNSLESTINYMHSAYKKNIDELKKIKFNVEKLITNN